MLVSKNSNNLIRLSAGLPALKEIDYVVERSRLTPDKLVGLFLLLAI
jgi:hypothetical protein